ncbi:large subunit ribosomal protein L31 [Pullulanibacillus pueri]|uniref:Large ribosomal subunit protein bL31 n=1 Tax=Pullulanibacillus pueri TaxID=1437324 RepID=A0A8J2ZZT6_9BACL|nr:50S ribosomal protein L31 [Pullulanibacillus pueri]MBM7681712.1 large subunit ribosomal protein L31 [Pullulanibacillus pueri]GGH87091.1 50S ribosomal protein L31 [Pullulanibacillus pueri]
MQASIQPQYNKVKVQCTTCGNEFETGSTLEGPIRIDVCSECHPFYTGRQRFADKGGRVDRFKKKYNLK